jgi:hypothetical protein
MKYCHKINFVFNETLLVLDSEQRKRELQRKLLQLVAYNIRQEVINARDVPAFHLYNCFKLSLLI